MPNLEIQLKTNYTPLRDFHLVQVAVYVDGAARQAFGDHPSAKGNLDYATGATVSKLEGLASGQYLIVLQIQNALMQPIAHKRVRLSLGTEHYVLRVEISTPPPHIDLGLPPILPRG